MKLKLINLLIAVISFINFGISQNSTEIGLNYSFSYDNLVSVNSSVNFENKIFHSVGVNARRNFSSKLFVIGGINLKSFGTQVRKTYNVFLNPDGTEDVTYKIWKGQGIEFPVSFGYYFLNRNRIKIGTSLGLVNLVILKQMGKLKDETYDTAIFNKHFFSLKSTLDIRIKIKENVMLHIIPSWQRQLNSNFLNGKIQGFGTEIGVSYKLENN